MERAAAKAALEPVTSFDAMGLHDDLLRGVYAYGFVAPSPIQQVAIAPILAGRDVVAQAQSGTGKTGAFGIALLQLVDRRLAACQGLVLCHTRELAQQTQRALAALGAFMGVTVHACVGGSDVRADADALRAGAQVVVGTPGRIAALLGRRTLRLDRLRLLVVDEADKMLGEAGFADQVTDVLQKADMPATGRIAFFSATLDDVTLDLAARVMPDAVRILLAVDEVTLAGIKQYYVDVPVERGYEPRVCKLETLCDLYESISITQAMIYCNARRSVEWVTEQLTARGFTVSAIHGETEPVERERIMRDFRAGASRVLVTTDLLARGIDVQQVSLVINFELPVNVADYVHRIGRSGRWARKGKAINLVTPGRELGYMRDIEAHYRTKIADLPADLRAL